MIKYIPVISLFNSFFTNLKQKSINIMEMNYTNLVFFFNVDIYWIRLCFCLGKLITTQRSGQGNCRYQFTRFAGLEELLSKINKFQGPRLDISFKTILNRKT